MMRKPRYLRSKPLFADPITDWMPWFAWRPVRTWEGEWVWWKWIERRLCQNHSWLYGPSALDQWFQYQTPDNAT